MDKKKLENIGDYLISNKIVEDYWIRGDDDEKKYISLFLNVTLDIENFKVLEIQFDKKTGTIETLECTNRIEL